MNQPAYDHRRDLTEQAVECLNRYTHFKAAYRVTFALDEATGRIGGRMERSDGIPLAEGPTEMDKKLSKLKDQTAVIRPFFLPMCNSPWKEDDANLFSDIDFDYAAILGYGLDSEGKAVLKAFYYPPTEALFTRAKQEENGSWKVPIATFNEFQLSLDPRKKFARYLYLSEKMSESLEYQIDKTGYFYSNP